MYHIKYIVLLDVVKMQPKKKLLKDTKKIKEKRIAKRIDCVLQTVAQSFQSTMTTYYVTRAM
jgi:hypothetical protein